MENQVPTRLVWITDDDEEDCNLFEEAVKQGSAPVKFQSFRTGTDIMIALKSGIIPDILFLDLLMPIKDGFDCLKEIRKESDFLHLPIVVYSDLSPREFIANAYEYGANLYYKKPFGFAELVKGLDAIFQLDWTKPSTITSAHYINNKYVTYDPFV